MSDFSIAISIVSFNSKDLFVTLDNLKAKILPFFPAQVYVFDNNSTDDFKNKLVGYQNDLIQIHFNSENKGFGFGHNFNAKKCSEEFFLVCNPDILVDKENMDILYTYLKNNQGIMVAPKVVYPTGETQYLVRRKLDVFDYVLRFIPVNAIKNLFSKRLSYFECRDLSDEIQPIKYASGCFMFTRTKDFLRVEGFDERFFMYFEDNDICNKYNKSGLKIIYNPKASVVHFYAKEAHKSSKVFKIFIKSMVQYFNKWGWKFF